MMWHRGLEREKNNIKLCMELLKQLPANWPTSAIGADDEVTLTAASSSR